MKKGLLMVLTFAVMTMFTACSSGKIPSSNSEDINNSQNSNEAEEEVSSENTWINNDKSDSENEEDESSNTQSMSKAEVILKNMTLEEKIGQLFIVRPDSLNPNLTSAEISDASSNGVTQLDPSMKDMISQYQVGGVALFGKNIVNPKQVVEFNEAMQQASKIPLFLGVDEEGGIVSRIANAPEFDVPMFESMEAVGATGDSNNARNVGLTIGSYLKQYGFNLDFAPVADVNTNPQNIVIGNRAFGNDPNLVAEMVAAEVNGLKDAGIMSCVKHFPGHGDTNGDTHEGYVSVNKTWEQLKNCELIPFSAAFSADTNLVMVAHITTPNITSDGLPASISEEMVAGKLRNELNYNGVVITDSMEMGAITKEYTSSESAVKAILAGVDIVLMPEDFVEAYNGIYAAVQSGTISEERIDESVMRILTLKEKYGLLK